MNRWISVCVASALLAGGSAWAVLVETNDFQVFGDGVHLGDEYEWMDGWFYWEHSVDLTIKQNSIIAAWLMLDTARIHQSSDPVYMGAFAISLLSDGERIPHLVGYLTPNPGEPEVDTILAVDPALLMAFAHAGGGSVRFGVSSALITPDNYDDINLYSSRLVIWYEDGTGSATRGRGRHRGHGPKGPKDGSGPAAPESSDAQQ